MTGEVRVGLIVVAAGSSRRMGGIDKIWADLGGRPVVWHSLARLSRLTTTCVLVVRGSDVLHAQRELGDMVADLRVVAGGRERQDSVANGLCAAGDVDVVAVHDAARPFASVGLLQAGVELVAGCEGAIPVQPLSDTVKEIDTVGRVVRTVDRSTLRTAQTPQVFRTEPLRRAHREARVRGWTATDDSGLLEAVGCDVACFQGEPGNFKITTEHDLALARLLLLNRMGE